jgi:hypothetical protein
MRVSGKWIPIILFCCASLARAADAQACGPLGCGEVRDVQPADGTDEVPLNTEIRIRYFGATNLSCRENPTMVWLAPDFLEPHIEIGTILSFPDRAEAWLVVKPRMSLLPDTRYGLAVGKTESDDGGRSEWEWIAEFTTASEDDLEAPEITPVSQLSFLPRNTASTECGDSDVVPFVPRPKPVITDSSRDTRYNVYVDEELVGPYRDSLELDRDGAELYLDCGTSALFTGVLIEPGSRVEIRAVDVAGNESPEGDSLQVPDRCNENPEPEASGGGCSVSVPRRGPDAAWMFALLAMVTAYEARASKRRSLETWRGQKRGR